MCRYTNGKTVVEDNKKHKRNLSTPIQYCISDYVGNVSTSDAERIVTTRGVTGIFSSRRFRNFNRENMAGAVSDDPTMSRMTNEMLINGGSQLTFNGTDSELEGYMRHSAMQLNHQNSVVSQSEMNAHEPGM